MIAKMMASGTLPPLPSEPVPAPPLPSELVPAPADDAGGFRTYFLLILFHCSETFHPANYDDISAASLGVLSAGISGYGGDGVDVMVPFDLYPP